MDYQEFIDKKRVKLQDSGISIELSELSNCLFDYQKDVVIWALKRGRAAIFTGTGSGKTIMQLEYSRMLYEKLGINILILAPLAVREQTIKEGKDKLNLEINDYKVNGFKPGININNYQQLDNIDISKFECIVMDESSIIKSMSGTIRNQVIEAFANTPYKLACTATPSPNDYMELGNHSEFLNVMKRNEMLSMYFVHDGDNTQEWRLKGHAEAKFWEWVAEWAVVMRKPEDLGYTSAYQLPKLEVETIIVDKGFKRDGMLFEENAQTLDERREARKNSIDERVEIAANIANSSDEMFLCWTDFNEESTKLSKKINGAYEITGSDEDDYKSETMLKFAAGDIRVIVSKSRLCGFGLNFQKCHNVIYCGLSDSFESYYQSVRRCYRFGQKHNVKVWIVISSAEMEVLKNIQRKERDFDKMMDSIIIHTRKSIVENLHIEQKKKVVYKPVTPMILPKFIMECVK